MQTREKNAICLVVTGASGAAYGMRLLQCLLNSGHKVYFLLSRPARVVIRTEMDLDLPARASEIEQYLTHLYDRPKGQLNVFEREQWTAPVASGNSDLRATVVCPCSMGTLASVASGLSRTLIERAIDVGIKENKQTILVVRETPFSAIHLENMLKLSRLGVTIMPANPGFYHQPQSIDDLVDFLVARILDHLGIAHDLMPLWGDQGAYSLQ